MEKIEKLAGKIVCPVCSGKFVLHDKTLRCENNHCFDFAKEGYVNLLTAQHKNGSLIGDNKSMANSRRDFLNKGYFSCLADEVAKQVSAIEKQSPVVLDICCGEGYYSYVVAEKNDCRLYGFDLSKEMVRLAAKRKLNAMFFVANISSIPLADSSVDFAFHLFAPFHEKEFSRILKKDGKLITVFPGENHLFSLKQAVYDTPYKNDEKAPETTVLEKVETIKVSREIHLDCNEDIMSLFSMTPYYYRTSKSDLEKLKKLESLDTTVEFVVAKYTK